MANQGHFLRHHDTCQPHEPVLAELHSSPLPSLERPGILGGSAIPWFGRINTIKMDTLPKPLYLFQTIAILIPKAFFAHFPFALSGIRAYPKSNISYSPVQSFKVVQDYLTLNYITKLLSWHVFLNGSHVLFKKPLSWLNRIWPQ